MSLNLQSIQKTVLQNKVTTGVIAVAVIVATTGVFKYVDYKKTEDCKNLYETYKEVGKTLDSASPLGESYMKKAVKKCHDEYRL